MEIFQHKLKNSWNNLHLCAFRVSKLKCNFDQHKKMGKILDSVKWNGAGRVNTIVKALHVYTKKKKKKNDWQRTTTKNTNENKNKKTKY